MATVAMEVDPLREPVRRDQYIRSERTVEHSNYRVGLLTMIGEKVPMCLVLTRLTRVFFQTGLTRVLFLTAPHAPTAITREVGSREFSPMGLFSATVAG